jgi:hypothetical protein
VVRLLATLIDQDDPIPIGTDNHCIMNDLDILGASDQDLGTPKP